MTRSQVSVNTRPVADRYGNEKIIEFSSPAGGGLISFTLTPDGRLAVHVYRQDMTVTVSAGEPGQPVSSGNLRADKALYLTAKAYAAAWETRNTIEPNPSAYECAWCDADIEQAAAGGDWYDALAGETATECDDSPGGTDTPSRGQHVPGGESLIREARGWIADCFPEVDVALLSARSVIEGVQRNYEGGWAAFVAAADA